MDVIDGWMDGRMEADGISRVRLREQQKVLRSRLRQVDVIDGWIDGWMQIIFPCAFEGATKQRPTEEGGTKHRSGLDFGFVG